MDVSEKLCRKMLAQDIFNIR